MLTPKKQCQIMTTATGFLLAFCFHMYLRDPLKHTKKRKGVRIYAHCLFHFLPIWTNLDKFGRNFVSIEILVLNDERLKK